jgi:hypothetical protein
MRRASAMTNGKVVINLATGLEDGELVTVAFLVANAAAATGRQVAMFLTKEAVRPDCPDIGRRSRATAVPRWSA